MAEALEFVGHMQTRSRGTIGGSLCHLDPAAELPAVLLAHDAVVTVAGDAEAREIAIGEWFAAYMTPNLEPTELLRSISIPLWPSSHGYAFVEFSRRRGDFALVGIGCLLALGRSGRIERASIVVCGVDTRPHRCEAAEAELIGAAPDPALFERAAGRASEMEALGDSYADKSYRQRLAKVLTGRALAKALSRISGAQNG
jgi:carbon-monoxide dehydrogenase medium subunit